LASEEFISFIEEAKESGGSELANYQLFVERLCRHLDLPSPDLAKEENKFNDYVFERRVAFKHASGMTSAGRIDLYKRDCFILEAKQSSKRQAQKIDPEQGDLLPEDAKQHKAGQARRGTRNWDRVMSAARKQAEDYARALPVEHGYPPFLLIVDVGNVVEVFADFSGQGKNYAHFPDRQSYRLTMDDLLREDVQERLRLIWTNPQALDPTRVSAEVTTDIARRLAKIAKSLERKYQPKQVAEFLMRCLFTMFAEDVELIPDHGFEKLLKKKVDAPQTFAPALESLWKSMDKGGYDAALDAVIKRFNGALFKNASALPLDAEDINELYIAARRDWKDVEPAIFGTLLEQALDKRERSKLGAHFTPRTYVERLVIPTVIEPLRDDWEDAQARAAELDDAGDHEAALTILKKFHHKLCTTKVLDPACGTGNFLYVSLELMKRLEGEVLEVIESYRPDDSQESLERYNAEFIMDGETVTPRQFYGLELNERAVPIADLVLWIGYLKWQLRTGGPESISEPVLDAYGNIRARDAILDYDKKELRRDEHGKPVTIWDGYSMKPHPVTGRDVPDEDQRIEGYTYHNPRRADWPETDFIVGNPPFIGGKDMRFELGDGYAEACWAARPEVPGGADFVMHFWDEAARRLTAKMPKGKDNPLRRFGFITTNSITQTFSRRVIERYQGAKPPLSLVFAIPDHPWMKSADKAAVRIAMTVSVRGERDGVLAEVVSEEGLNTDTPEVRLERATGKIKSNFTLGADLAKAKALLSNEAISSRGVSLHGAGFIVSKAQAKALGLGRIDGLEEHILDYRNGRDLAARSREAMVIDAYGLTPEQVRKRFPEVYQHLVNNVKGEREAKRGRSTDLDTYADDWWLFGKVRTEMRAFLENQPRYIATIETTKHRIFFPLKSNVRPDNKLVTIGLNSGAYFACLSSRTHYCWYEFNAGKIGVYKLPSVYVKTSCFDKFPFPTTLIEALTNNSSIEELGNQLDTFRKERLADWDALTMTGLYNALERYREAMNGGDPLTEEERDVHEKAQVAILAELHDEIDRAVLAAYGWEDLAPALVGKPGGTTPSPHKSAAQEEAEEELLSRLVALNQERAAEEARGVVRWLRPDYQIPKLGHKVAKPAAEQSEADLTVVPIAEKPKWPKDGLDQIRLVRDVLAKAPEPVLPEEISATFDGKNTAKRKGRIKDVLETLVATGTARTNPDDTSRYFMPR